MARTTAPTNSATQIPAFPSPFTATTTESPFRVGMTAIRGQGANFQTSRASHENAGATQFANHAFSPMDGSNFETHAVPHLAGFRGFPGPGDGEGGHHYVPPGGAPPPGGPPPPTPGAPGGYAFQTAQAAGGQSQPGQTDIDYESKVGDVLAKFKSDYMIPPTLTTNNKAVDFHSWTFKVRLRLNSKHSQIGSWWNTTLSNATEAHQLYLNLSPLQRSGVKPSMNNFMQSYYIVERYMAAHLLSPFVNTPRHTRAFCVPRGRNQGGPHGAPTPSCFASRGHLGPARHRGMMQPHSVGWGTCTKNRWHLACQA